MQQKQRQRFASPVLERDEVIDGEPSLPRLYATDERLCHANSCANFCQRHSALDQKINYICGNSRRHESLGHVTPTFLIHEGASIPPSATDLWTRHDSTSRRSHRGQVSAVP